jgi:proteic killer suppression protein
MIRSFGDSATEDLYHGRNTARVRKLPTNVISIASRKLDMLNAAASIQDLRSPPGNRLEKLAGDLEGFYSLRVNDQWRILFQWADQDSWQVRLVDYH